MPPKKSAKKASTTSTDKVAAAAARVAKKEAEREALEQWVRANDPLLDAAPSNPIRVDDLFTRIIAHKSFPMPSGGGQAEYDWSVFRSVLEARTRASPRWFVQLREEDLLAGSDGLEGVTVDCFVVAEVATGEPTLSPSEYVVKVHWPYSDAEDNAPERILPIAGQNMCWRRVVKQDGSDINMYLLQKRDGSASTGATAAAAATPAPAAASFGFGAAPASGASQPAQTSAPPPPSFGFGSSPDGGSSAPVAPASFGFGFGATAATTTTTMTNAPAAAPISFGFGSSTAPAPAAAAPALSFGFGAAPAAAAAVPSAAAPACNGADEGAIAVQPLKTSEVLFSLWSLKRLTSMAHEVRSGGRIVREKFPLSASTSIKLVMENDRKDDVAKTVRRLILNRLFAKQDPDVVKVDKWINDCPVYDERLATALQAFREQHVSEAADESESFAKMYAQYHGAMEAELQRIVDIRARAAQSEIDAIEDITEKIKDGKLAPKSSFRLLKYYPKNDVQKFRPFGKIGGISEMGESVDVCEPPAHVNINPFTGKAS